MYNLTPAETHRETINCALLRLMRNFIFTLSFVVFCTLIIKSEQKKKVLLKKEHKRQLHYYGSKMGYYDPVCAQIPRMYQKNSYRGLVPLQVPYTRPYISYVPRGMVFHEANLPKFYQSGGYTSFLEYPNDDFSYVPAQVPPFDRYPAVKGAIPQVKPKEQETQKFDYVSDSGHSEVVPQSKEQEPKGYNVVQGSTNHWNGYDAQDEYYRKEAEARNFDRIAKLKLENADSTPRFKFPIVHTVSSWPTSVTPEEQTTTRKYSVYQEPLELTSQNPLLVYKKLGLLVDKPTVAMPPTWTNPVYRLMERNYLWRPPMDSHK